MLYWGKQGAFWGGLWGLLFGSAFFFVPGVGPLLMAGPLVTWMVGTLEGAAVLGGFSALGAALASIGIPKHSILQYEANLKAGKFLLILHATPPSVEPRAGFGFFVAVSVPHTAPASERPSSGASRQAFDPAADHPSHQRSGHE